MLNSDITAPYSFVWSGATAGTHTITAVATDNVGQSTTSTAVTITVTAVQVPFKTAPHLIPGRIEAEDYDLGGQGVAYSEANTTGNQGLATYRNDQVDIETTQDATGTYNIGYALTGEWMEYTVNVAATGMYSLDLRLAADGTGKTMHVEMDGVNITGAITVPNTTGWQTWATVTLNNLSLTQGQKVMRIVFDSDYMNLNFVEFKNEIPTGLEGEEITSTVLYPNPFTNQIHVRLSGNFDYQLMNVSGQLLEEGKSDGNVDLAGNYPKGVYMLKIMQNNKSRVVKIVKE